MTEEQVAAHQARIKGHSSNRNISGIFHVENAKKKPRRNKYGNEPVVDTDGKKIASKRERKTRQELRARFRAGEINELAEQVWIRLGPTRHMRVDFSFIETATGQRRYLDAKGHPTPDWLTKQAWAAELGYNVETI